MPTAWAYWNSTERDVNFKKNEGLNFRSTTIDGFRPSSGVYVYTRPFRIESKGNSSAESSHFERCNGLTFAAQKLMVSDQHQILIYTPNLPMSDHKAGKEIAVSTMQQVKSSQVNNDQLPIT
jgi:hypothetical protein